MLNYVHGPNSLIIFCLAIDCQRLSSRLSDTYDFVNFEGSGVLYTLKIADGKIEGSPYGP